MENNLIAREKEEKITYWVCTGILVFSHLLIINDSIKTNWLTYVCMILSSLCIILDWISNFVFYLKVEHNPSISNIGTKSINIFRIISFFVLVICFIINYINIFIII